MTKCRHYNQFVPGCAYCAAVEDSARRDRDERTRVETLEGRLACETALVNTLRAENARLRAALAEINGLEPSGIIGTSVAQCKRIARAALEGAR